MVSLDTEGAFDNAWVDGVEDSAARLQMPNELQRLGTGIPSGPKGNCAIRWREVQEGNFQGLHTELNSRYNLLEPQSGSLLLELGELSVFVQAFADNAASGPL
ncbi:hypothetical protein EVAR_81256_1 [Eumeta japonica]|uniref:Uncharacterized protein n=1 Tax=Eumeta variegata TaxID=151549 RepID=A0A4C1WRT3_EUMVA|nr:hypothetical protein EVAR_81256_1 [Eumeta japonica]